MSIEMPVYVGYEAAAELIRFLAQRGVRRPLLVADANTYQAQGRVLCEQLGAADVTPRLVLLQGQEIVADARSILRVLVEWDPQVDLFVSVGAGTITDIVRFAAHRTGTPFVSIPTAPSVDGYPSSGAPIVIDGFKQTIPTQPPAAIFADLGVLCDAPRAMIAAGLGDILGKFSSLADWQLGHLLWDEPYDAPIAERTHHAVTDCIARIDEIGQASCGGIETLTHVLLDSGLSMAEAGNSRPASGSEHHLSHYWEMKLLQLGRPAILHGAKVGVASLAIAELYRQIREMSPNEVEERLDAHCRPSPEHERRRISQAFGRMGAEIAAENGHFIDMTDARYDDLRQRIATQWPRIQQIATTVPTAETLEGWLRQAGGPVSLSDLGMTDEDLQEALQYAHYLRDRFTVLKLAHVLGMIPDGSALAEGAIR